LGADGTLKFVNSLRPFNLVGSVVLSCQPTKKDASNMQTGVLHTHTLVVGLFLAFYAVKAILLIIGKEETLNRIREKTKVVDMVLGFLILATGSYLMVALGAVGTYLWVKLVAVLALIPIGIIAMKRQNKALAALGLIGFVYFYGVAETHSLTMKKTNYAELAASGAEKSLYSPSSIYVAECQRCHGELGDLGVYGAANLRQSKLNEAQIAGVITMGQGKMKGYEGRLNSEQLSELAAYIKRMQE
jgi:mono/diheme cytochrome c family protein